MAMQWKYSNGYDTSEFTTILEIEDDVELTDEQKDLFLAAYANASSKTVTLGLADGQPMFVTNIGDTAFTVVGVEGDEGTEIDANDLFLVIGLTGGAQYLPIIHEIA